MAYIPIQSPPLQQPELIEPHTCVDITHGTPEHLVAIRIDLLHGANYNRMSGPAITTPKPAHYVAQPRKGQGRRQQYLTPQTPHDAIKEFVRQGKIGRQEGKADYRRGRIWA
jgi:cyanobactin biosynthesis protein (PatB/AcyB/McaB family)